MPSLPDFEHIVGAHCSSTSVQNVLRYDGIALSEAMVFGLGSGLGFFYIHDDTGSPTHRFNGRAADLEGNFYRTVEHPLQWALRWDPPAMAGVLAHGRPILVQSDIYYLPYYQPPVHFIGHGIVLVGLDLDAGTAQVADIAADTLLALDLADLHAAIRTESPPLLKPYRWAEAPLLTGEIVRPERLRRAILRACAYLLTPPSAIEGLPAMARMARALPRWKEAGDWRWAARFGYQAIEKRGTGGGGFRLLYAAFLEESRPYLPQIDPAQIAALRALGARWTALATALKTAFVEDAPVYLAEAGAVLAEIVAGETAVLTALQQSLRNSG